VWEVTCKVGQKTSRSKREQEESSFVLSAMGKKIWAVPVGGALMIDRFDLLCTFP
jgi:hypothetical protein